MYLPSQGIRWQFPEERAAASCDAPHFSISTDDDPVSRSTFSDVDSRSAIDLLKSIKCRMDAAVYSLEKILDDVRNLQTTTKTATMISGSVGFFGGLVGACAVLAPFTGGLSLLFGGAAAAVAVGTTATAVGFQANKVAASKQYQADIKQKLENLQNFCKPRLAKLNELFEQARATVDGWKAMGNCVSDIDYALVTAIHAGKGTVSGGLSGYKGYSTVMDIKNYVFPPAANQVMRMNTFKAQRFKFRGFFVSPALSSSLTVFGVIVGHGTLNWDAATLGEAHELEEPLQKVIAEIKDSIPSVEEFISIAETAAERL